MSVSKRVHCGASASMAQHPLRRRQALGLIGSLGIGFAGASAWAGQAALQTPPRVLYERLHSFDENTDPSTGGAFPTAGLIQASDGFIYGTCQWSGPNGGGTVYRLVAGEIETVHAFEYLFADGPKCRLGLCGAPRAAAVHPATVRCSACRWPMRCTR
jgi:hypothetical protein